MTNTETYCAVSECLAEDMDGELLIYNPTTNTTVHLNGSSAMVWGLCDGQNSVQNIIELLVETFPEQADQIPDDVADVIRSFKKNKIIESVQPVRD